MKQPEKQTEFVYPFGNPQAGQQEDAESYHSLTTDDRKLRYFDDSQQSSFSKKTSESMIRKKNLLPPVYPYQEMKKLKESMRLQQKKGSDQLQTNGQFDTQSIRSVDSFHTANQFQSICYEEGDYEKIAGEMKQEQTEIQKEGKIESDSRLKSERSNKSKIQMKKSDALNEAQLQELQGSRSQMDERSSTIYDRFDQNDSIHEQSIQKRHQQQNQSQQIPYVQQQLQEQKQSQHQQYQKQQFQEEKSVEISQIQKVLNESMQVDNEILQLTKQLEKAQISQEELILGNLMKVNHQEWNKKRQQLIEKYDGIAKKIIELQQGQKYFTSEMAGMTQLMRKTQENNLYLKKQVQFFKHKSKQYQQQKQRQEELYRKEKQERMKQKNDLNMSNVSKTSDRQGLWGEGNRKSKTYHIRPKAPANQSYQSRKYKQLTFEYCFGTKSNQQWNDLEVDRQNTPPQYKLIYSFQQQNTLLVLRLIQNLAPQPQTTQPQVKKNYQYMMDFASNKYPTRQQKMQSLSKELIVHLDEGVYCWKEFTKKIQVFLIIKEDEVSVDLVRVLPLPNPIVFYVEERFGWFGRKDEGKTEIEEKSILQKEKENANPIMYRNLQNLHKLMKTYIIKIQHMADINSIQKLISLPWVNTVSNPQPKYFSIRHKQQQQSQNQARNQLFYLKIENCVLQNKDGKEKLDEEHRYSLTFRVASNIDNALIVDMIEFLTFLTVM